MLLPASLNLKQDVTSGTRCWLNFFWTYLTDSSVDPLKEGKLVEKAVGYGLSVNYCYGVQNDNGFQSKYMFRLCTE